VTYKHGQVCKYLSHVFGNRVDFTCTNIIEIILVTQTSCAILIFLLFNVFLIDGKILSNMTGFIPFYDVVL
jgi:hypothetical protein